MDRTSSLSLPPSHRTAPAPPTSVGGNAGVEQARPGVLMGSAQLTARESPEAIMGALKGSRNPFTLKSMGNWIKENPVLFTGIALASVGAIITTASLASGIGAPGAIIGITLIGIGAILMVKSSEWDPGKKQVSSARQSQPESGPDDNTPHGQETPISSASSTTSSLASSASAPASSASPSSPFSPIPTTHMGLPAGGSRRHGPPAPPPPGPASTSRLPSYSDIAYEPDDDDDDEDWERVKHRAAESSYSSYSDSNISMYPSSSLSYQEVPGEVESGLEWNHDELEKLPSYVQTTEQDTRHKRTAGHFMGWVIDGVTRLFGERKRERL